jgi:hypothetical protein
MTPFNWSGQLSHLRQFVFRMSQLRTEQYVIEYILINHIARYREEVNQTCRYRTYSIDYTQDCTISFPVCPSSGKGL